VDAGSCGADCGFGHLVEHQASGLNLTFESHLLPVSLSNVKFIKSTRIKYLASGSIFWPLVNLMWIYHRKAKK